MSDFCGFVLISLVQLGLEFSMIRSSDCRKVELSASEVADYFAFVNKILLMMAESGKVHFNRDSPFLYDEPTDWRCLAILGSSHG